MDKNIGTPKPNISRSFLLWWMLANIVGLPVLLLPYNIGYYIMASIAIMSDGGLEGGRSVVVILDLFIAIILAIGGILIGGWLGVMQWLVLRTRFLKSRKWIWSSIAGVVIGAPLSWLVYELILYSPIANRPDAFYFSFWYEYIAFGVTLGLSIGISQWLVLKQQANWGSLWILALPICFTLGMASTDPFIAPDLLKIIVQPLAERIAAQSPNELMNYDLIIISYLNPIIALLGIGLITGFLLDWLLGLQKRQVTK